VGDLQPDPRGSRRSSKPSEKQTVLCSPLRSRPRAGRPSPVVCWRHPAPVQIPQVRTVTTASFGSGMFLACGAVPPGRGLFDGLARFTATPSDM